MKESKSTVFLHILIYTIAFSALFFFCYGIYYIQEGKSFLWVVDGMSHSYALFFYTRKVLHSAIRTLLAGGGLQIPRWDFAMGYGSDIFITLGVGLFDPFNWISVFIPYNALTKAFDCTVILRMYCAGLSFLAFSRHKGKSFPAGLTGSIIYLFSSGLYIGFYHADFINVFYIFPLLMIGVERFWERRGRKLYVFLLAYAFINSFYFGYMMSFFILGYCLLRMAFERMHWRKALTQVGRFLAVSLLAVGMSMFAVLPIIMNLVGTDRLSIKRTFPLFYDKLNSGELLRGIFSVYDTGRDAFIGVLGITLIALVVLFMKKGHAFLKTSWILLTVCIFIPYFGHILNGMSYASHRWIFAHVFVSAYLVTSAFEVLTEIRWKEWLVSAAAFLGYLALSFLLLGSKQWDWKLYVLLIGFGLIFAFLLLIVLFPKEKKKLRTLLVVVMTASSAVLSAYYNFWPKNGGVSPVLVSADRDQATEVCYQNGALYLLDDIPRDQGIRYDEDYIGRINNSSWYIAGMGGLDFYEPYYNNNIDRFNTLLGVQTLSFPTSYFGLNGRSELEALSGVRYYMTPASLAWAKPDLYSKLYREDEGGRCLYQAGQNVSMAYYFDRTISEKNFGSLSMYERQKALMKGILLENNEGEDNIPYSQLAADGKADSVMQSVKAKGKSVWNEEEKSIQVNKAGSGLEVQTESGQVDGEVYVSLKNLTMKNPSAQSFAATLKLQDQNGNTLGERSFAEATIQHHMYGGRTDWLINVGTFHNVSIAKVEILFGNEGVYSVDNLDVIVNPETEIQKNIGDLQPVSSPLQYGTDQMSLEVNAEKSEYVLVMEPYSTGWTATINGKEIKIEKADQAFMALKVPKGKYQIEFHYRTPWQREGIIISVICLILFTGIDLICRKKGRMMRKIGNEKE